MADDSGVTYGPSVSRYTRVPINYSPGAANESHDATPLGKLLPFLVNIFPKLGAYSTVNSSGANPSLDARHEDIHNLMFQMFGSSPTPVTPEQKDAIAPALNGRDVSNGLNTEIPAYMGAYNQSETPDISPAEHEQFVKDFAAKLAQTSQKGSDSYKKLSR